MKPTAFITGATSGIGKATAEIFAKNNIRLILCGRRSDRLEKLQQELSKLTDVTTLQFDVSKRNEVDNAIESPYSDHGISLTGEVVGGVVQAVGL
jgi:3-hydroxy acid dehydrogenase/malonic semialdehyde reductase